MLPFTPAEADPILKTISKIHRVTLVAESPYATGFSVYPRICLLDDGHFGMLNPAMLWFPGKTSWVIYSDLPRCYLAASIAWKKPAAGSFYSPCPEQADLTIETSSEPEPDYPLPSSPEELRQWAIDDMPALATYLEDKLNLQGKPSLGIEVSSAELDLPLIEDSTATGDQTVTVLLAADPERFLTERRPTSTYDRVLHAWIDDEEYGRVYDVLHDSPYWQRFPTLARVIEQGIYGVLGLSQEEVRNLKHECELAVNTANLGVTDTLTKIARVCRSALAYKLGLVIEGD